MLAGFSGAGKDLVPEQVHVRGGRGGAADGSGRRETTRLELGTRSRADRARLPGASSVFGEGEAGEEEEDDAMVVAAVDVKRGPRRTESAGPRLRARGSPSGWARRRRQICRRI